MALLQSLKFCFEMGIREKWTRYRYTVSWRHFRRSHQTQDRRRSKVTRWWFMYSGIEMSWLCFAVGVLTVRIWYLTEHMKVHRKVSQSFFANNHWLCLWSASYAGFLLQANTTNTGRQEEETVEVLTENWPREISRDSQTARHTAYSWQQVPKIDV